MVITICNEKGGSGKSTIVINLASRFAQEKGCNLLLIDTDSQRSIETFTSIREYNGIKSTFTATTKLGSSLMQEIKLLEKQYNTILIDTGGRDSKETRQALILSNAVIVPCIASQFDIAVLDKMINILLEVKATINPNLKVFFVLSRGTTNLFLAQKNDNLKNFLLESFKENEVGKDFILLNSVIHEREAYKNSIIDGLSIFEFCKESDKAYIEFETLYQELFLGIYEASLKRMKLEKIYADKLCDLQEKNLENF